MSENENKVKEAKRKLNITLSSFTMFATPRTRKDRKQLRLTFGCTNGYPNVNIETDEEGEPSIENGFLRLSSRLNGTNFHAFLSFIEAALKETAGWHRSIECYHTYKDGEVLETPQKINDLKVGVDNQGLIYITILQPGRTSAKFRFGPTEWHNYKDHEGNALSQKEQNHICAKASVEGLRAAMSTAIAMDCMDNLVSNAGLPSPSKKPENGSYGGGSGFQKKPWNNNGDGQNNQGGFQKKPWNNNGGGNQGGYNNQNGGYQKKQWGNNSGGNGGQAGFQKKPWNNNGGNQNGGYQKSYGNNQNNQGGFQKKPWENKQNEKPENDFSDDDIEF